MLTVVIGGAGSGKSGYAEALAAGLSGRRIYLATMEPSGAEARVRIARHRKARQGKGFMTVECCRDIGSAPIPPGANVLVEDLGNLLANEMFPPDASGSGILPALAEEKVFSGLEALFEKCLHVTLVTNELGAGGAEYGEETLRYLESLGRLNCRLAARADRLVEVICGIPRLRKGEK